MLSSNAFAGDIPTEIGRLKALEELWLANNQFGSTLPSELGNLIAVLIDDGFGSIVVGGLSRIEN